MSRRGFVLAGVLLVLTLVGVLAAVAAAVAIASLRSGAAWSESVRAELDAWALTGADVRVLGDSVALVAATGLGSGGRGRWPVMVLVRRSGDSAGTVAGPVRRYPRAHPRP